MYLTYVSRYLIFMILHLQIQYRQCIQRACIKSHHEKKPHYTMYDVDCGSIHYERSWTKITPSPSSSFPTINDVYEQQQTCQFFITFLCILESGFSISVWCTASHGLVAYIGPKTFLNVYCIDLMKLQYKSGMKGSFKIVQGES